MVDNFDSFTGSLVQLLLVLGARVRITRSDVATVADADGMDLVVLSPGPGRPEDHPVNLRLATAGVPIFGVCLGLQAIAQAFGGDVVPARRIVHGLTSRVHHRSEGVFEGLPSPFRATRYHSLCARAATLPECLQITAWTADGTVMGLRHRRLPVEGVQFHPESVRSEHGLALIRNVLKNAPRRAP